MIEPLILEKIRKETEYELFKIVETEDCLQKSAIKLANYVFDNSNDIATGETRLPLKVGWEFTVKGETYQMIMEIKKLKGDGENEKEI